MKKLAIGCAVVLVLCFVVAGGVGYYLYRQARSMVTQFAELGQVADIEKRVQMRGAFTAPSSEEMTAGQVERLLRVQTKIKERLGARFAEMEQKYQALSQKKETTLADAPQLMAAYRDLAAAWVDAKRAQVDALNEVGLSLDEYRWVRDHAYRALGMPYIDFDVSKFADAIRNGATVNQPGEIRGSIGPAGPESNRKLIEPFKKQLEDNVPLASFGL